MANQLIIKPQNISEFFFSGSQPVYKGEKIAWVSNDSYAFKVTADCKISVNKTPFVFVSSGQVFIIDKGKPYVFDRDTVLGIAYPQEATQDLLIQNDIYNNNKSVITVEADQTPFADAGSNKVVTDGDIVTLYGSATPVAPATITSVKWIKNGSTVSTTNQYQFTANTVGTQDYIFQITDSNGRQAQDSMQVVTEAYIPPAPILYIQSNQTSASIPESNWFTIFQKTATRTDVNANCILNVVAGFSVAWKATGVYTPSTLSVRLLIGGATVYTTTFYSPDPSSYTMWYNTIDNANFTHTVNNGDSIQLQVYWTDAWEYAGAASAWNQSVNGEMQLSVAGA